MAIDAGAYVYQVQALPDADGDGTDELLVPSIYDADYGAPFAGLLRGSEWSYLDRVDLDDAPLVALCARDGAMGYRVALPGDVFGDGVEDIALGAYQDSAGGEEAGAVAVVEMPG